MNEASWDRIARVILGAVLLVLGLVVVNGGWGVAIIVVGLIALVTGAVGFCPIYWITKFRTKKDALA